MVTETPVDKERAKNEFRASRLQWSSQAEHRIRQELNDIAIQNCHEVLGKFAECAKESSLAVIFKCRAQNRAMNECLHSYTNDEEFAKYREKREGELLKEMQHEKETST